MKEQAPFQGTKQQQCLLGQRAKCADVGGTASSLAASDSRLVTARPVNVVQVQEGVEVVRTCVSPVV